MSGAVCIDPSLSSTGVVFMRDTGHVAYVCTVEPPEKMRGADRLVWMAKELLARLEGMPETYQNAVLEGYAFGAQNQREALGELGGVYKLVLHEMGCQFMTVAPSQLKKFVGVKQKDEIRLAVYKKWGFEHASNDVVDAFVLGQVWRATRNPTADWWTKPQREVALKVMKSR